MAAITPTPGTASGPIPLAQVLSPAEIMDEAAKTLVVQDARYTRSWIDSRFFQIRWIEIDLLYQSPPTLRTWEGTSLPKANISEIYGRDARKRDHEQVNFRSLLRRSSVQAAPASRHYCRHVPRGGGGPGLSTRCT